MSKKSFMRSPISATMWSSSICQLSASGGSSMSSMGWLVSAAQSGERAPSWAEPRRQLSRAHAAAVTAALPTAPIALNKIVPTSRSGVISTCEHCTFIIIYIPQRFSLTRYFAANIVSVWRELSKLNYFVHGMLHDRLTCGRGCRFIYCNNLYENSSY